MQDDYRVDDMVRWLGGDAKILERIGADGLRIRLANHDEKTVTTDQVEFSPFWAYRLDRIESGRFNREDVAWLCRMVRMKVESAAEMQKDIDRLLEELHDYRILDDNFIE